VVTPNVDRLPGTVPIAQKLRMTEWLGRTL
jgi:hypothetical protein